MLILRCKYFEELLSPLPSARLSGSCLSCLSCEATVRLSGGCLSCEVPGGTTTLVAARFPALKLAPALTTTSPSMQGPGCSRGRGTDLRSSGPPSGRSIFAVLCPPDLPLSQGENWILGCVSQRIGLQGLCLGNHAPKLPSTLHAEPLTQLLPELLPGSHWAHAAAL